MSNGSFFIYEIVFDIFDFFGGFYIVKIKDDNDCSYIEVVYVNEIVDLLIDVEVIDGICGENGLFWVFVIGGVVDFIVSWDGLVDGSVIIDEMNFVIIDFFVGIYIVYVIDVGNCMDY